MSNTNDDYMKLALHEARTAFLMGEVPVGAVVVNESGVVAQAHNSRETDKSALAHAELLAIKEATEVLGRWRLSDCTVFVTLEPCIMCAGLMYQARIAKCVFGASDPKAGALGSLYKINEDDRLNHNFEVESGILEEDCSKLLKEFFQALRKG